MQNTLPIDHISYSSMRTLMTNPYLFKKIYIDKDYSFFKSSSSLALGKSFHLFCEKYYQQIPENEARELANLALEKEILEPNFEFGKTQNPEKLKKELETVINFWIEQNQIDGEILEAEATILADYRIGNLTSPLKLKAKKLKRMT